MAGNRDDWKSVTLHLLFVTAISAGHHTPPFSPSCTYHHKCCYLRASCSSCGNWVQNSSRTCNGYLDYEIIHDGKP